MPVFQLNKELVFPNPSYAEEEGILAIGGDLSIDRLLLAYVNGIFPWFTEGSDILWWSPDPRMVLFLEKFKLSDSLKQLIRSKKYTFTVDRKFSAVIKHCAKIKRKDQDDTWITKKMTKAYIALHKAGFAHSIETWQGDKLVGGLYGVSLGKVFFGESMFHLERDASKFAFYHLVQMLKLWDFEFIDAQQDTAHLRSLGAMNMERKEFMERLDKAVSQPTFKGNWNNYLI
jgi:leucyl/phenylalanyl-tRNA--protein transferase